MTLQHSVIQVAGVTASSHTIFFVSVNVQLKAKEELRTKLSLMIVKGTKVIGRESKGTQMDVLYLKSSL